MHPSMHAAIIADVILGWLVNIGDAKIQAAVYHNSLSIIGLSCSSDVAVEAGNILMVSVPCQAGLVKG